MRCEEYQIELSCTRDGQYPSAVARHIAECPECREWSLACRRIDLLWDAARPQVNAHDFSLVWNRAGSAAGAKATVGATEAGATQSGGFPRRSPMRPLAWVSGLSAAAAALAFWFQSAAPLPRPAIARVQEVSLGAYSVEEGETALFHLDGNPQAPATKAVVRVDGKAASDGLLMVEIISGEDAFDGNTPNLLAFNCFEGLAEQN